MFRGIDIERNERPSWRGWRPAALRGLAVRLPAGVPAQIAGAGHDPIADAFFQEANPRLDFAPPDHGRAVTEARPWIDQYDMRGEVRASAEEDPRAAAGHVDKAASSRKRPVTDIDRAAVAVARVTATVSPVRTGIVDRDHDQNARRGWLIGISALVAACCPTRPTGWSAALASLSGPRRKVRVRGAGGSRSPARPNTAPGGLTARLAHICYGRWSAASLRAWGAR
ncbi:hypothetical protein EV278_12121 [Caulobacter sp. BK020]|nr:hypothetical protein EV278_12121 [Caulobacter sp. BK020]